MTGATSGCKECRAHETLPQVRTRWGHASNFHGNMMGKWCKIEGEMVEDVFFPIPIEAIWYLQISKWLYRWYMFTSYSKWLDFDWYLQKLHIELYTWRLPFHRGDGIHYTCDMWIWTGFNRNISSGWSSNHSSGSHRLTPTWYKNI